MGLFDSIGSAISSTANSIGSAISSAFSGGSQSTPSSASSSSAATPSRTRASGSISSSSAKSGLSNGKVDSDGKHVSTSGRTGDTSKIPTSTGIVAKTTTSVDLQYKDTKGQTQTYTVNTKTTDLTTGKTSSVDQTVAYAGISAKELAEYSAKKAAQNAETGGISPSSGFNQAAMATAAEYIDTYNNSLTDTEKAVFGATNYYMKSADGTSALALDVDSSGSISGYDVSGLIGPRVVETSLKSSDTVGYTEGGTPYAGLASQVTGITAKSSTPSTASLTTASASPLSTASSEEPVTASTTPQTISNEGASTPKTKGDTAQEVKEQKTDTPAENVAPPKAADQDGTWFEKLMNIMTNSTGSNPIYITSGSSGSSEESNTGYNIFNAIQPYIIPALLAIGAIIVVIKLKQPKAAAAKSTGKAKTA